MNQKTSTLDRRLITSIMILLGLILLKTVAATVGNLVDYFPPDFTSDFLAGRESYFYGPYQIAFSSHVVSGPVSLILGLLLVTKPIRTRWPTWHRRMGKLQVMIVILLVAPSGFWMAFHAVGGVISVTGFASLAVLTQGTAFAGYMAARTGNFRKHEVWMARCFLLLVSAVVLRLIAGIFIVVHIESDWIYPTSAWISWLLPLSIYELFFNKHRQMSR